MKTRVNKKAEVILTMNKEEFNNLRKAVETISQKSSLEFLSNEQKLAFYQLSEILSL